MKNSQIIAIIPAINELRKLKLPYNKAHEIYEFSKKLIDEYNFIAEEESKLIKEYGSKDEKGNAKISEDGKITFDTVDLKNMYMSKIAELTEHESDIKSPSIILHSNEIGMQFISAETIEKLEGIITFK